MRAGLPVRAIFEMTFFPPMGSWAPIGTHLAEPAPAGDDPSQSRRPRSESGPWRRRPAAVPAPSRPRRRPPSGGAPRATSVATRRSAACSSASRATCSRFALLAIAVATSSVISASRSSTRSGSGAPVAIATLDVAPRLARRRRSGPRRPNRSPTLRPASTSAPASASATSSIRIGWPARMCSFIATSEGSSQGQLEPAWNGFGPSPHVPTTVTVPSRSHRKIWTSRGRSIVSHLAARSPQTPSPMPPRWSRAPRCGAARPCCSSSTAEGAEMCGGSGPGTRVPYGLYSAPSSMTTTERCMPSSCQAAGTRGYG